ncbi:MAG: ELWxxDGT repeat protein [Luteolibacter sp.]
MKFVIASGMIALASMAVGAVPRLVADVNQQPFGSEVYPSEMVGAGGRVFFRGYDRVHGGELWMSDGSDSGTRLVKDLQVGNVGSQPYMLRSVGTRVFFFADDGEHGVKLWSSDGNQTVMAGGPSQGLYGIRPQSATAAGGLLYFTDGPSGGFSNWGGWGLWRSDGTEAGTWMLNPAEWTEFWPYRPFGYANLLTEMDGNLYFANSVGEVWRSTGTQAETVKVADLGSGAQIISMAGAAGRLWITVNRGNAKELWSWFEGAAALLTAIPDGALSVDGLTALEGRAYFVALTPSVGGELWTSNGSVSEKVGVADDGSGPLFPENLTWVGATLFCTGGNDLEGYSLWASNGEQARLVKSWGDNVKPTSLVANAGILYFIRNEGGEVLWKSDGTEAGTMPVKQVTTPETAWGALDLTSAGGSLYFKGNDGQAGFELWSSNGTSGGTGMVKDLQGTRDGHEGIYPGGVGAWGDQFVFYGNDGLSGAEPWTSDGTAAGTRILADVRPGPEGSEPTRFTAVGGKLYFSANDGVHGDELWRSDTSGTALIQDINPGSGGAYIGALTPFGDRLAFKAENQTESGLWVTDGNDAIEVKGTWGNHIAPFGGGLLFTASDPAHGEEPWWTDGETTRLVKDLSPGSPNSSPAWFTRVGNEVYFEAYNGAGFRLWRTDGTESGTTQVAGWQGPGGIYPMVAVGNRLFFFEEKGTTGLKLWTAQNGQAQQVRTIGSTGKEYPFDFPADPFVSVCGNLLFFVANDGEHGDELWRSDGAPAGTRIVRDIRPGSMGSAPSNLMAVGGVVYFQANDGISGEELWVTDGTSAGTQLVADMVPGSGGSAPSQLQLVGKRLFFGAVTEETGREPYVLDVTGVLDFHAWTEMTGLTGIDAAPAATPYSDGVANLLKYAFGIDGTSPYQQRVAGEPGDLPHFSAETDGDGRILQVEYARRTGSSLIYSAKRSATLQEGSFVSMSGVEWIEPMGSGWEKIIRRERVVGDRCFAVIEVTLP